MTGDAPLAEIPRALKEQLVDETGRSVPGLTGGNFARVMGASGSTSALASVASPRFWRSWPGPIPPFRRPFPPPLLALCGVGYLLAYLNNFFHEAAHHNLLPVARANDIATNVVMGWLFGSSIQQYRKIHFQHHRALGTTMDSENSYFDPLRLRYMAEGLLGLKVLRTLRRYRQMERERPSSDSGTRGPPRVVRTRRRVQPHDRRSALAGRRRDGRGRLDRQGSCSRSRSSSASASSWNTAQSTPIPPWTTPTSTTGRSIASSGTVRWRTRLGARASTGTRSTTGSPISRIRAFRTWSAGCCEPRPPRLSSIGKRRIRHTFLRLLEL